MRLRRVAIALACGALAATRGLSSIRNTHHNILKTLVNSGSGGPVFTAPAESPEASVSPRGKWYAQSFKDTHYTLVYRVITILVVPDMSVCRRQCTAGIARADFGMG